MNRIPCFFTTRNSCSFGHKGHEGYTKGTTLCPLCNLRALCDQKKSTKAETINSNIMLLKNLFTSFVSITISQYLLAWGFYMHKQINYHAVFLLPPEMLVLYKPNIDFLSEHAVDPDKRRYAV